MNDKFQVRLRESKVEVKAKVEKKLNLSLNLFPKIWTLNFDIWN